MIPVEIYSTVYYGVLTGFVLIFACLRLGLSYNAQVENQSVNSFLSIMLLSVVILFIGLRDPQGAFEYFGDTRAYMWMYDDIGYVDIFKQKDVGFSLFMKLSSLSGLSIGHFFLVCALLYVLPPYLTFRKWFSGNAFYALVVYVTAMSFWTFGINGVRNGLAASFFIFSLGYFHRKWLMVLLWVVAVSFHKTMLLPVAAFVATRWLTNTKKLIFIWPAAIAFSFLFREQMPGFINTFLGYIDETRGNRDFIDSVEMAEAVANIRFRYDFILYSSVAIVLGWFYIYKKNFREKIYVRLVNTYIIANTCWILLFMYFPYTNRYAYLSWFLMPVIMVYPLLKEKIVRNQYGFLALLILGNLLFTLIMYIK